MKIEHVAIWSRDIETLKGFYEKYLDGKPSSKYTNEEKKFQSYFLTFSSGARLELMQRPDVMKAKESDSENEFIGYAHLALSVGSEDAVDAFTKRLVDDGFRRMSGPRRTGDGYYESGILDLDGNLIEITA